VLILIKKINPFQKKLTKTKKILMANSIFLNEIMIIKPKRYF